MNNEHDQIVLSYNVRTGNSEFEATYYQNDFARDWFKTDKVYYGGASKGINNVIDYAHCDERSEFLDVFLGATSKFCIGSSSGYYHIPFTFSVPVLFTNSPRFEEYYGLRKNNLYLRLFLNF